MALNAVIKQTVHICSQALAADGLPWRFTQPNLGEYEKSRMQFHACACYKTRVENKPALHRKCVAGEAHYGSSHHYL